MEMNSAAANQKKITNPVRSMYDVLICIAFIYPTFFDYKQWSISYRLMDLSWESRRSQVPIWISITKKLWDGQVPIPLGP